MGSRLLPSRFATQFKVDVRTLFCPRVRDGPRIAERALALDRIAGPIFLGCVAGLAIWVVSQMLPSNLLQVHVISERAEAAAGTSDLAKTAAAKPLTRADMRIVQTRLKSFGFDPGTIDGVAGPRTLKALNQYRAAKTLSQVSYIDRATIGDLLN